VRRERVVSQARSAEPRGRRGQVGPKAEADRIRRCAKAEIEQEGVRAKESLRATNIAAGGDRAEKILKREVDAKGARAVAVRPRSPNSVNARMAELAPFARPTRRQCSAFPRKATHLHVVEKLGIHRRGLPLIRSCRRRSAIPGHCHDVERLVLAIQRRTAR